MTEQVVAMASAAVLSHTPTMKQGPEGLNRSERSSDSSKRRPATCKTLPSADANTPRPKDCLT